MSKRWDKAQTWEAGWWDTCQNTFGEEEKQWLYAEKMLLGDRMFHNLKSPYNINMHGDSVIDIGGGPVSLLLKCFDLGMATVVDPLEVPYWVELRYEEAGIEFIREPGEDIDRQNRQYDEAWIYNCLQHTQDPQQVINNACGIAKIVRIFEWLETGVNEGHPHSFNGPMLDKWLGGEGKVTVLNGQAQCYGKCYHGVFLGDKRD